MQVAGSAEAKDGRFRDVRWPLTAAMHVQLVYVCALHFWQFR